jgi:nucleoside-diphosphate-sugar epimerase
MSKILITGGTGFIGSHITRFYVQEGHEVRVIDNNSRGRSDRIDDVMADIDFIEGDIQNYSVVETACKDVDTIVHLAFINGTANFYNHPDKVLDVAIKGILSVASAISKHRIENLILASSSEVYQTPKVYPTPEDIEMVVPELDNPRYSYGLGKIVQEFYAYHALSELLNLNIFRPHNIYGSDMGNLHVIPQLFEKVISAKKTGKPFNIEGSGDQTRSFCHINDFIQGFSLISKSLGGRQVFNIGTKEEVSIKDLAHKIANIVGVENGHTESEMPAGGTLRRVPDICKIEALGFQQKVALDNGLDEYYKHLMLRD